MPETTGQRVELPSEGKRMKEARAMTEKPEGAGNEWQKESAPKECHAVSKHDINKKSRGRGKRDRLSSPSPGPRSHGKDSKDEKRCNKRKMSRKEPGRLLNPISLRVSAN